MHLRGRRRTRARRCRCLYARPTHADQLPTLIWNPPLVSEAEPLNPDFTLPQSSTCTQVLSTTVTMAHSHSHSMSMEPWLNDPVMLHSNRTYTCSLNLTEQCEYQQGYWRFWFEADHRYALPTVALFMVTILLFSIPYLLGMFVPRNVSHSTLARKATALSRFVSYRSFRIGKLNWNSAPIGVLFLGAVGTIFFFAMTLGPQPYYWPNRKDPPLSFGNSPPIATRTGWMALACLPFIIATSSKSNLITGITGISHEKLQVFHRWISYACFVLALVHTFPFIVFRTWRGDVQTQFETTIYYWTGIICLITQVSSQHSKIAAIYSS